MNNSVPASYFIDLYRREADPWNFAQSDYEREKYERTIDVLPCPRYRRALELACSIGVFTSMLARRCDALLAIDVSPDALERARARCASLPHVQFACGVLPQAYPPGRFDLTTVCEVGFYLCGEELLELRQRVVAGLEPGGHAVLVHWTPRVDGHATTTEEVHACFAASPQLTHLTGFSEKTYRLDLFEKRATR